MNDFSNVLMQLHQRPIAYFPIYRKITGSTTAAILFSQLMFWWSKMNGQKFYKTDAEIQEETCLTDNELRGAKDCLKKMSFVKITREGVPCKTFYEIDYPNLFREIHETGNVKSTKQDEGISRNSILQENTQENTTKELFVGFDKPTLSAETDTALEEKKGIDTPPAPPLTQLFEPSQNQGEASERVSPKSKKKEFDAEATEIIAYLNEKAQRNFPTHGKRAEANKRVIASRLRDGFMVEELKKIIQCKVAKWFEDVKMKDYLRPETLFCPKHCTTYLEEATRERHVSKETNGLVFDIDLNGQTENYKMWWNRTKETFPNVASEIRFFTASEFKSFQDEKPNWLPMYRQIFSTDYRNKLIKTALADLEADPHRKRNAEGGLFSYLTNYFIQKAGA